MLYCTGRIRAMQRVAGGILRTYYTHPQREVSCRPTRRPVGCRPCFDELGAHPLVGQVEIRPGDDALDEEAAVVGLLVLGEVDGEFALLVHDNEPVVVGQTNAGSRIARCVRRLIEGSTVLRSGRQEALGLMTTWRLPPADRSAHAAASPWRHGRCRARGTASRVRRAPARPGGGSPRAGSRRCRLRRAGPCRPGARAG